MQPPELTTDEIRTATRVLVRIAQAADTHWIDRSVLLDAASQETGLSRDRLAEVLLTLTANAPARNVLALNDVPTLDLFTQWGERIMLIFHEVDKAFDGGDQPDSPGDSGWRFQEEDIQSWLASHVEAIEPGLKLLGKEYPVGGRFVDLLAQDLDGALVVIEIKVTESHEKAVGQLLRYVGWVRENLAREGQAVRGVLVTRDISEDLRLACVGFVELFEIRVRMKVHLRRVSTFPTPKPT